jgi:transglutaminase-like putative cysteine protease
MAVVSAPQVSPYVDPRTYLMTFSLRFINTDATVNSLEIYMPLPVTWDSQKDVTLQQTNPQVTSQLQDNYGNGILYWRLGTVNQGSTTDVSMQVTFTAYNIEYQIDPNMVGSYDKSSAEYMLYTRSENYVEAAYGPIARKAQQLVGSETNPYRQARLIYDWVMKYMTYKLVGFKGAKFAYDNGYGECGEYSALFAALSRAVGIPARLVVGLVWDRKVWSRPGQYPNGDDRGIHVWAEFLLPGYGWIPADAERGARKPDDYFAKEPDSNVFLIMSKGTNIQLTSDLIEPIFQHGAYWYHGQTGKTSLRYSYTIATA